MARQWTSLCRRARMAAIIAATPTALRDVPRSIADLTGRWSAQDRTFAAAARHRRRRLGRCCLPPRSAMARSPASTSPMSSIGSRMRATWPRIRVGFRIAAVSLTGQKEVSREEILTTAGVTGHASLLFLDADAARARLMANPWIADAAVLKLYPDRLQITITERLAFALWQKDGHLNVIAADGTVLEPFVEDRYLGLPLVVGRGAERQAKDFLAIIDRYPDIRSVLRASILVAERRWNLRLTNGIDVRLPEANVEAALDRLVQLDHDKKLLSRDITMVDLRLPDRVSVRLSDAAAQARDEVLQGQSKKKKAGDA